MLVTLGDHNQHKPDNGEITARVRQVILHQQFQEETEIRRNDIALLILDREISFDSTKQPICLPNRLMAPGTECYVAGWGCFCKSYSKVTLK